MRPALEHAILRGGGRSDAIRGPNPYAGLCRVPIGCLGGQQSDELVESAVRRVELVGDAHVPFADEPRLVAGRLQDVPYRQLLGVEPVALPEFPVGRALVELESEALRITPGEQPGTRRRTDGRCSIGGGEAHALLGKPVDVGGLVAGGLVGANVCVAQVIGQDQDDIGLPGGFRRDLGDWRHLGRSLGRDADDKAESGEHRHTDPGLLEDIHRAPLSLRNRRCDFNWNDQA